MAMAAPPQEDPEGNLSSFLECPICYVPYDNTFKTPLLLPCSHTFCMECLSRLCLFHKKSQEFPCPLCRTPAQIPQEGVPKMQPNLEVVAKLPPEMQTLQEVWADGYKLCWMKKKDSSEGKGSLVTIHLLSSGGNERPGPEGLISIQQSGCRAFCHSVWGIGFTILTIGILLFTVLFLPIYMNSK
ncbi:RING finger protein 223-like [Hyla sarda]|uniref:RING finger protein 223-like n=1 Tax=Hyla sarda TaxID=327740 RepID=UPI0024C23D8A|nr:RING finger protein 223-like [Hyla sarda]XP_056394681.1 RING finger protein 223-like [Hyla sarda]